jgi:hypothetical protein
MSRSTLVVVIAVVLVVALVAFLIIRRQRYLRGLRSHGWTFDTSPALDWVLDHHAPPFGLGFVRTVDEGISGTVAGVPFRVFEYDQSEGGPRFGDRLASLALPLALPDLFLSAGPVRSGVGLNPVEVDAGLDVRAADPAYAQTVLSPPVLAAIAAFGQAGHRVDLSVDGQHLVAVGAPKDPDELSGYLERLAAVALAFDASALAAYETFPLPPGFGFYGRPDWQLVGSDDSLLGKYGLTTAGFGHTTEKVIRGSNDGLPLEAFVHRWKTRRTETYRDSQGRTQTRTVTEEHSEILTAVALPFSWPLLSLNGGSGGDRVRFESEEFNDRFKVRVDSPKLAYDVIHPRTMEFLMAIEPPPFRIEGQLMRFFPGEHDTQLIGFCADVAHAFFRRVPAFVWEDLEITPPAFRESM